MKMIQIVYCWNMEMTSKKWGVKLMLWNMLSIEKKIVLYHHGNIICARICMTDKQTRVENERGRANRKKTRESVTVVCKRVWMERALDCQMFLRCRFLFVDFANDKRHLTFDLKKGENCINSLHDHQVHDNIYYADYIWIMSKVQNDLNHKTWTSIIVTVATIVYRF